MAEKQVTIKVATETDTSQLQDLNEVLTTTQSNADNVGEALKTAFEEAITTVEDLEEELGNIELGESDADFDEISIALEEARDRADELADAIENIDSTGLNDATDTVNALSDALASATGGADALSESMGLMDGMALMDIGNEFSGMGGSAEEMAEGIENVQIHVGQLATEVGIAEPKLVSMINYISNETFPQSEALAYVQALNQMGVSADKLGDSATNMDKINDATGIGYEKVMQLTQGLRSMGISADNLPASFNAIAYAQSNVNGGAGTLTQVLKRQASTINEYGLNVDQLVIIMQKLSEQGVQGMKMGSALSEVLKETNGDTTALEQSLGLTAGALSNASQYTGEYAGELQKLADEEMDHKTLTERLGAVWEDLTLQFSWFISPATSVLGLLGEIGGMATKANAIITLAETFGILKEGQLALIPVQYAEGTAGWFSIGWIVLAIALGIALGLALVYLYNHSERFRNAVNWLGNSLKWLAGVLVSNISNAVNKFKEIIFGIPNAIKQCLDWAYQIIMNNPIVQALQWLGEKAVYAFSVLGLGQHSPGDIVESIENELSWGEEAINDSRLPRASAILGQNVVDEFGNPRFNTNMGDVEYANSLIVSSDNTGNNGNVYLTLNIDNVDSRERVNEIIRVVDNYFKWDNKTAGRTV